MTTPAAPPATPQEADLAPPTTPQQLAILKLAALRKAAKADSRPARVVPGLYVGGIGAARNLKVRHGGTQRLESG